MKIKKTNNIIHKIFKHFKEHTEMSKENSSKSYNITYLAMIIALVGVIGTLSLPIINSCNSKESMQIISIPKADTSLNNDNEVITENISGWWKMTTQILYSSVEYFEKNGLSIIYHINIDSICNKNIYGYGEKISDILTNNPKYKPKIYKEGNRSKIKFTGYLENEKLILNIKEINNKKDTVIMGTYIINKQKLIGNFKANSIKNTESYFEGIVKLERIEF